jgi:hypothetical protein
MLLSWLPEGGTIPPITISYRRRWPAAVINVTPIGPIFVAAFVRASYAASANFGKVPR